MEDGDAQICRSGGRQGSWYSFGDGSGSNDMFAVSVIEGGRGPSRRAVHFTGGGFTNWGAIAGLNFSGDGLTRNAYRAPAVGGLTFWMKSTTPITVQVLTEATVLVADGGACDAAVSPNDCNNSFAFQITAPDAAWKQYQVPFTALRQLQPGTAAWDPSQLFGLQFLVGPGADFDLWIDDVAFYYCAAPECVPTCTDANLSLACPEGGHHIAGCFPGTATCAQVDTWCGDPALLDDLEDGDRIICASGGRQGNWYPFGDAKASFQPAPIPGGRGASNYAAHLTGSHLTDWGAGIGFTLASSGREVYDASAADGITFWMKTTGFVLVNFRRPETTPTSTTSGTCTDTNDCNHHFGYNIDVRASDWAEYHVPFTTLHQLAGGSGRLTWDPKRLLAIEFAISSPDLDLWIDDVRFYNCTGDACVPTCTTPESPVACPASPSQPSACWPAGTDCANPPDRDYTGVWGSSGNDVWIVGTSTTFGAGYTLHWDGVGWTSASTGTPGIWGIWGSDADNAWMAGQRGTMRRRVGSDWIAASSSTTTALLQGMWGSGPNDVWASGNKGTIVHWDGNSWSPAASQTTNDLWGLWTSGPTDGWAVGVGGTALRLTASGWSPVASGTSAQFDGVWGSGPNDVWAVGDAGTIRHWDGSMWTGVASGTTNYLDGVWGSGPDDIYVVGYFGTVLHWDGLTLSPVTIPVTP
jgi:hypothetical protein